jgi:hypothetical protein
MPDSSKAVSIRPQDFKVPGLGIPLPFLRWLRRFGRGLAGDPAGHKLWPFAHHRTLLPRNLTSSHKKRKVYPCVRYDPFPMSRVALNLRGLGSPIDHLPSGSNAAQGLKHFKNVFNLEQTRRKQNGYFCCIHPQWWPLHLPHEAVGHAT